MHGGERASLELLVNEVDLQLTISVDIVFEFEIRGLQLFTFSVLSFLITVQVLFDFLRCLR